MPQPGKWGKEETEKLLELYRSKITTEQIAKKLNRTYYSISSKLGKIRKKQGKRKTLQTEKEALQVTLMKFLSTWKPTGTGKNRYDPYR